VPKKNNLECPGLPSIEAANVRSSSDPAITAVIDKGGDAGSEAASTADWNNPKQGPLEDLAEMQKKLGLDEAAGDAEALEGQPSVSLTVPITDPGGGHHQAHVQLQLDCDQAKALGALYMALDEKSVKLKNGKRVRSRADAVRWLLSEIHSAMHPCAEEADL
jgi:hypothetical protein